MATAGLGQIQARGDAQPAAEGLQQHRHQAGEGHHPEQAVAIGGARRQIGGPVAWIHVAHRHQVGRTKHPQQGGQPPGVRRNRHGLALAPGIGYGGGRRRIGFGLGFSHGLHDGGRIGGFPQGIGPSVLQGSFPAGTGRPKNQPWPPSQPIAIHRPASKAHPLPAIRRGSAGAGGCRSRFLIPLGTVVASVSSIARRAGPSGLSAPLRIPAGEPAGSASDGQT